MPTNSEAMTGAAGSSKSSFSSLAQKEWMSPPSTTGLASRVSAICPSSRCARRRIAVPILRPVRDLAVVEPFLELGHQLALREEVPARRRRCGTRGRARLPAPCRDSERRGSSRSGQVASISCLPPPRGGRVAGQPRAVLPPVEHQKRREIAEIGAAVDRHVRPARPAPTAAAACAPRTPDTPPRGAPGTRADRRNSATGSRRSRSAPRGRPRSRGTAPPRAAPGGPGRSCIARGGCDRCADRSPRPRRCARAPCPATWLTYS